MSSIQMGAFVLTGLLLTGPAAHGAAAGGADGRPDLDLQDPTRPSDYTQTPTTSTPTGPDQEQIPLTLRSLLISPQRRLAIINGRLVGVGDQVAGAEVLAIDDDAVVVRRSEQELRIPLALPDVKSSPPAVEASP